MRFFARNKYGQTFRFIYNKHLKQLFVTNHYKKKYFYITFAIIIQNNNEDDIDVYSYCNSWIINI